GHSSEFPPSVGLASVEVALEGLASGSAPVIPSARGTASGSLELEGLAGGHAPEVADHHGEANGILELSASIFGRSPGINEAHGTAEGTISLESLAVGYTPDGPPGGGSAEVTLVLSCFAIGSVPTVTLEKDYALRQSEYNGVGVQDNTVYDKGADALTASDKLRLMSITGQTNNPRADPDPSFWYGNMPPTRSRRRPRPRYPRKRGTQA